MIGYSFLRPTEEEMYQAALYYEEQTKGLGFEFLNNVQRSIDNLREFPELGPAILGPLRRHLLRRFPFSLIYSIEPDALLIIAVAHHRRRPGYWLDRGVR